jgi:hypothetical protein
MRQFLGDSYDAVKRLWQETLVEWAPLLAEPSFIPEDIQRDFTALTRIPVLANRRPPIYSILNDPDTGIHLPDRENQKEGLRHINLATMRVKSGMLKFAVLSLSTKVTIAQVVSVQKISATRKSRGLSARG